MTHPAPRRRGPGTGLALGVCAVFGLLPAPAGAVEVRWRGPQMLLGINIDLVPSALVEGELDADYLPQLWVGFGRERLGFAGDEIELPKAFVLALNWIRNPATDEFTVFASDPVDEDSFDAGAYFTAWLRRDTADGIARVTRWPRQALRLQCGYAWRLALDFTRAPWSRLHVVLVPQTVSLLSYVTPLSVEGRGALEVVWFPCGTVRKPLWRP